ncbi:hypothetical protein B9Z55_027551 [Caenorhabditis nigoni]|uniref:Tc1-like transposase DDE domain-containing protein n=1 Tax=Caenorhabditis nigoni TaxID=1611254 RepID=A0A2G5SFI9_9PELO|nr:hypothetical protein B9Z55_027551 [Caenorhabditis nigoni]
MAIKGELLLILIHSSITMPRGKCLTELEKGYIAGLKAAGYSNRSVADVMGRSRCLINAYTKNPELYGQKKHIGRPPKTTSRERRMILRAASNSILSSTQIKTQLKLDVSSKTVRRVIKKSRFIRRYKMRRAPFLSAEHRQKREQFARAHINTDWSKIIWSDEKKFNLDGPDGYRYYWHDIRKEKMYLEQRSFKGGRGVMVWACFGSKGRIQLNFTPPRINSDIYKFIMRRSLLPYIKRHRRDNLLYQQDNASSHKSRSTMRWFQKKHISLLDWPAHSPDLNPQENVWGHMVRKIYQNGRRYTNQDQLKKAILEAWKTVDQSLVDNLVLSMDDRMFKVIQNRGGPIDY